MSQQLVVDWGIPNLVGTLTYQLKDASDSALTIPLTTGILEDPTGSGNYYVTISYNPSWGQGIKVIWSDGTRTTTEWISSPIDQSFTGARSVSLYFLDTDSQPVSNVVFTVVNVGSAVTDNVGFKNINLADGSYVIRVLPSSGLLWTDTPITVASNSLSFTITATGELAATVTNLSLSSVSLADTYFGNRLYSSTWFSFDSDTKQQALNAATQLINRLKYKGQKSIATQLNEFPRYGLYFGDGAYCGSGVYLDSTLIPSDILAAQYEIAFALINGYDIDKQANSNSVISRTYQGIKIAYDPKYQPDYQQWGIPSQIAWQFLFPYLDDGYRGVIAIHRVN